MTIRVLVADDQEMVRAGFRMILDAQDDVEVVADAADGRTALDRAWHLRPEVCLLDIRMPGLDGLEVTRLLAGPGVVDPLRVVIVTTFNDDAYFREAIANGASGFLLRGAGPALLVEAVRAAARGDALVSPSVTIRLLEQLALVPQTFHRAPAEPLTVQEEEVLVAVTRGRTNAEVADELYVSLSTIKSHLAALQGKLRARNRVEPAAWAWQSGRMQP